MKNTVRVVLCGLVIGAVTGCASKTDLYILQDDIKELKTQSQKSGGQTAEVYTEVEKLREEVGQLQGTIEELRYKLASEQQNVAAGPDSLDASGSPPGTQVIEKVTMPPEEDQGEPADTAPVAGETGVQGEPADTASVAGEAGVSAEPEPSAAPAIDDQGLYDAEKRYFDSYNYSSARKELGLLLDNYPSSSLADDAQYYIAETYFNEKWFEKAILEYQLVIEKYPKGDKRPAAFFKQGLAFENIGDSTNAKVRYKELVQLYPDSNEAKIVGAKLQ